MTAAIALVLALAVSITVNVMLVLRKKVNQNRSVRTAILSGIENVSELATIRERFQSIISYSDGMKIPGLNMNFPGTTRKFMLKYYGTIVCGCDLSKAKISERFDVNRVRITLPHSEVLDVYADVHSFEVYDQHSGIFTSIKLDDQNREVNSDLEKVKAHELEKGILMQSDDNVRKILTSVVASTGMEAEIVFTDKERAQLPGNEEVIQLEATAQ